MTNIFANNSLLEPLMMKDQVAGLIKEAMMSGQLQAGERIVELRVAKQLGVGTTCVREALFELEKQGFVARIPNKGAYVTEFSKEDTEQIYRVRIALEGLAAELAQANTTPTELQEMQRCVDEMKEAAHAGDLDSFFENDLRFHREMWALSRNRVLVKLLESLVTPLFAFYLMRTRRDVQQLVRGAEKHQRILDAIRTGDPGGSRKVVEETLQIFKGEEEVFLQNKSIEGSDKP